MRNALWCFALAATLVACLAGAGRGHSPPAPLGEGASIKLCSKRLADVLNSVCDGVYPTMSKRRMVEDDSGEYDDDRFDPQPRTNRQQRDLVWPYIPKTSAEAMLVGDAFRRYRRQRGIVDECCRKRCTYGEMIMYCGD